MSKLFTPWNTFLMATAMIMGGIALDGSISASLVVGGVILVFGVLGRQLAADCMM